MKWAKTTKYQASITIGGKVFNVICERDLDDCLTLTVNGEYLCDLEALPTYEELVEQIEQQLILEEAVDISFNRRLE
jgi:hypothetical protein